MRGNHHSVAAVATTAMLSTLVVGGAARPSLATADPAALHGVVMLPDGRPAAAATIDLHALSGPGGTVATAFRRTVTDRAGRYATTLAATPSLRLLAERTGGTLALRADVTDLVSNGEQTPVTIRTASVPGTATLSRRVPAGYPAVRDARTRAAATLVDSVLSALAVVDPAILTRAEPAGAGLPVTVQGLSALKTLVDSTVTRAVGSPPDAGAWIAYVSSLPATLRDALAPGIEDPALDDVVAWGAALGVYLDDLIDQGGLDPSDPGRTVNGVAGVVDAILTTAPGYRPLVADAQRQVDQAVAYAVTAAGQADPQARALAALVAETAAGLVPEAPDVQQVVDVANAALAEAAGLAERTVVALDEGFRQAMEAVEPNVSSSVDVAARLANYDPDMLLGNDDVDDPDLVPPLGATLEVVPVTEADDSEVPDGLDVLDQGGYGAEDVAAADSTAGCDVIRTRISPGKGKPAPTWGVKMRVIMKVARCSDNDPEYDQYAIKWHGKITNEDVNGEWFTRIVRFKFRTQLNAAFERDQEDPYKDMPVDGEREISWTVGFSSGATATVGGRFTAVKAKKIHPWSDYDGVLYHVSWMSNKTLGSRDGDFYNGGGNTFLTPSGEKSVAIKSRNEIFIWKCWTYGSESPWGGHEGGCDPK